MDCSLLGSSVHGIFQARVLEWGATAFSGNPKRLSRICLLVLPILSQQLLWYLTVTQLGEAATQHESYEGPSAAEKM